MSEQTSNVIKTDLEVNPHELGENCFHFYRCKACAAILTYDDEAKSRSTGSICSCGSGEYRPTNPHDEEWEKPKIKAYCDKYDIQPCYEAQL